MLFASKPPRPPARLWVLRASYALPRLPSSAVCGWLQAAVISLRVPSPVRWRAVLPWHHANLATSKSTILLSSAQLAAATKGPAFRSLHLSRITGNNNFWAPGHNKSTAAQLLTPRTQHLRGPLTGNCWHGYARDSTFFVSQTSTTWPWCPCEGLTGNLALMGGLHVLSTMLQVCSRTLVCVPSGPNS